jgi:hypothetical protein
MNLLSYAAVFISIAQLFIPLLAIALGNAILDILSLLFRDGFFDLGQAILVWLGAIVVGNLAIPVGLGGIIAAIAAVIIIFMQLGWGAGTG